MEERNSSFFRFEDLRIYTKSVDYSQWLLANSNSDSEAAKALFNSFYHSAFDIALNIAEGSSRTKNQFEHFLKIAKSAIRECVVYTSIAENAGYFTVAQTETSRESLMELTRMIGALILSLQKGSRPRNEHSFDPSSPDEIDTNIELPYTENDNL